MTTRPEHVHLVETPGVNTRDDWKNTILAGLANYIDSGSIVAGSVALAFWAKQFHLTSNFLGLIGAFSSNAISAGIGALIGGRLCDLAGRKRIYQWDMLVYSVGMLILVFAVKPWMIVVGFVIAGLAVGADIPASWTIIAEMSPDGHRGRHSGVAQVLWSMGPVIVFLAGAALAPLGIIGARIIFGHLVVVAILLWAFRFGMKESSVWTTAKAIVVRHDPTAPKVEETEIDVAMTHGHIRELFNRENFKGIAFLIGMYGIWNLYAGTNGFFFPYILRTVGSQSGTVADGLEAADFFLTAVATYVIFMRYSDRLDQKKMLAVSFVLQIIAMGLLAVVHPLSLTISVVYITLAGIGAGFGAQPFFQLWSGELFPTLLRSTAQGFMFAVVRIGLGIWSLFVPTIVLIGFTKLAWILTSFLVIAGIIGFLGAPRNAGKSLEEIQFERHHAALARVAQAPGSTAA